MTFLSLKSLQKIYKKHDLIKPRPRILRSPFLGNDRRREFLDSIIVRPRKAYPEKYVVMYRAGIGDTIHNDNETG